MYKRQGLRGLTGPAGQTGPQGPTGAAGADGSDGADGARGPQGLQGIQGLRGITGDAGPRGPTGAAGADGSDGADGARGATGPQGPQGQTGATGAAGPKGDQGDKGDTGDTGPRGLQGVKGDPGARGSDGADGTDGARGPKGDDGAKGDQGDPGPTGPRGVAGRDGAAGMQGVKGDKGDDGDAGPGLPTGGTDGQIILKDGTSNYATKWGDQESIFTEVDVTGTKSITLNTTFQLWGDTQSQTTSYQNSLMFSRSYDGQGWISIRGITPTTLQTTKIILEVRAHDGSRPEIVIATTDAFAIGGDPGYFQTMGDTRLSHYGAPFNTLTFSGIPLFNRTITRPPQGYRLYARTETGTFTLGYNLVRKRLGVTGRPALGTLRTDVGEMFTDNTETGVTSTYNSTTGKVDLAVTTPPTPSVKGREIARTTNTWTEAGLPLWAFQSAFPDTGPFRNLLGTGTEAGTSIFYLDETRLSQVPINQCGLIVQMYNNNVPTDVPIFVPLGAVNARGFLNITVSSSVLWRRLVRGIRDQGRWRISFDTGNDGSLASTYNVRIFEWLGR